MLAVALAVLGNAPPAAAEPTVIATIPVGTSPRYGVGVNPTINHIYVANVGSNNVSVIDGATNTEIDTDGNPGNGITRIPVGTAPAGVAANSTTNRVYVTNQNSNNVSVIDGATNTEIDTDGNPGNGITRIPVGSGPVGVAVNITNNRIYVNNFSWGSGSVSVIDGATNTEIDTDGNPANGMTRIPVGDRPHLVAVNTITNRIYVANWGSGYVSVIDGASNTVVATVPVDSGPNGVGVNPTTNRIYVTCSMDPVSDDVSVIDGVTNTEIDTDGNPANGITRIPVGGDPTGVAVNSITNRIYVASNVDNSVSVIDGGTNTVVATVYAGSFSYGAALNPATNRIYVTNRDDNTVSVIQDFPIPSLGGGTTERVSVDSAGNEANGASYSPAMSVDGRYVAFASVGSNLVPGDTNGSDDIFVHDRQTGATERVSADSLGNQSNAPSGTSAINDDGRYVAFDSYATNLVPGDTNGECDVFVHDRQTAGTTRVSVDSAGNQGDRPSASPAVSANGRYVSFDSGSSNLVPEDTNGTWDIFVHDRQTGGTTRASIDSAGNQADGASWWPAISADGRYVAFCSNASNLVTEDTNGYRDVFIHDRETGVTERVSVDSAGNQGNDHSAAWIGTAISRDGRYVAFHSWASNLVSGDTNGFGDIFVHDRYTGTTTRVSVDSAGNQENGHSWDPAISADGRYVAFQSDASNLVPGDTNGTSDIFVHDCQTGATERASVDGAGNQGDGNSLAYSISADGRYVAFGSAASNLVTNDTNGVSDVFVHDRGAPPEADVKIVSQTLVDPPSAIQVSEDVQITLRKTLHNNGPWGPVDVSIETNASTPGDCTAAPAPPNSTSASLPLSVDVVVDEAWTLHCTQPSSHTFTFDNSIATAGSVNDPDPTNNSLSTDLTVNAVAQADVDISSSEVVYDRKIDSDGDTVPDLAVVDVGRPTDLIVRKVLHNIGPHGPAFVDLGNTAAVVSGDAEVVPGEAARQLILPVSEVTVVDDTFTILCRDSNVNGLAVFEFENDVTIKDAHVVDPDGAGIGTTFTVYCVPRFTPTYNTTIDEDDDTQNPPADDTCIVGQLCKTMINANVPPDNPNQPLDLIQSILPAAINIAPSFAVTNGGKVGKVDFSVIAHIQRLTPGCVLPVAASLDLADGAMPAEGYDWTGLSLFPNWYDLDPGPGTVYGTGYTLWAGQLDAVDNFVQANYPGAVLWARYVGVAATLGVPVNVLVWNLGPMGWLSIGNTGGRDSDLDGLWDGVVDTDDDGDGVPNAVDNCYFTPNPDQADSDGDGVGDLCDPNPGVADPTDPEDFQCTPYTTQTIYLGETEDNPSTTAVEPDTEFLRECTAHGVHMTVGLLIRVDTVETHTFYDSITCLTAGDADGDGVPDASDNCPTVPNTDQTNTDVTVNPPGDAVGDACDTDDDSDGLADEVDVQPLTVSTAFGDQTLGGTTFGALNRNGLSVEVREEPNPYGVRVTASGSGGPATVDVCGIATLDLTSGDDMVVTCGSATIEVLAGPVEATLGPLQATLPSSTTTTIAELAPGAFEVTNSSESAAPITVNGIQIPPGHTESDNDGDGFFTSVEQYVGTDPLDGCPDGPGDDAWPLDIDRDGAVSGTGDAFNYVGRIGATPVSPNWWQRLDLDMDSAISVTDDVFLYVGRIGETCP